MRFRTCLLAIVTASLAAVSTLHAQAPAATAPPPAVAPVVVAPVAPVAPVPAAPAAEQVAPAVMQRREEEPVVLAPVQAGGTPPPSPMATRISAALTALRGQGAAVNQLADRDRTIADLRSQLAQRDQSLQTLNGELAQFRSDHAALSAAVQQLEGQRSTVEQTVTALGFDQTRLPAQGSLEDAAENTVEGLQAKLKAEPDSDKRSEIAAQMISLREKAAKKAA